MLAIFVMSGVLSSVVVFLPEEARAANFSGQLSGIREPSLGGGEEVGVWADRALIYLYRSSSTKTEESAGHALWAKVDGLNDGNIEYSNDCQTLTVNFSGNNATPSTGTLKDCKSQLASTVRLVNQKNAFIDGYSYGGSKSDETVFMPRYISGVDGCGTPSRTGKYASDGRFEKSGGGEYKLNGSNSDTVIKDYKAGSGYFGTAKQQRDSVYAVGPVKENCSLSYAGDGTDSGRTIYLVKGYTRDEVKEAIRSKIDNFQSKRGRKERLTKYFNDSATGRTALAKCQAGAEVSGSRDALINTLVDVGNNAGTNAFVDCMLRELESDSAFQQALDYQYSGNFNEDLSLGDDADCGAGGIPIITDLMCGLIKWMFNTIFDIFTGVIAWLATPPDMFKQQNSTLEQSMTNLRNVANVLFVIAFLMVVLQYLTNLNVADAYFIKKFIPRLVIAVVLVQASFWITAELNYFFHDLGSSVQSIVFFGQNPGDLQIGNGAATIALFAANPGVMGMLLLVGLIMLIVLLITLIILSIRYVLIIVLAIFAPLAFAAMAIPQLEGMTKKWFKMYVQLLMMYPIIMFFIAASSIVGGVFSGGGGILQLMGLVVQILPFIILPFTFKFAGGVMAGVTAKVLSAPKKGYGAYKKGEGLYESKTQSGRQRADKKKRLEQNKMDRATRGGASAAADAMRKAQNRDPGIRRRLAVRRAFGAGATDGDIDRLTSQREEGVRRQELDDAKARFENSQHDVSTSTVRSGPNGPIVGRDSAGDVDTDDIYKRVARGEQLEVTDATGNRRSIGGNAADAEMAMNQLSAFGRDSAVRELSNDTTINPATGRAQVDQAALKRAINSNSGALAGKAPDIIKGVKGAFEGGMSAPALAAFSAGTVDEAFKEAAVNPTAQGALNSALKALAIGPDRKPLSDMSRGTAEAIYKQLTKPGAHPVDASVLAEIQRKL